MKSLFFLFFIFINISNATQINLSKNDVIVFEKAKLYYDKKEYKKSFELFKKLFFTNLENIEINYFLAKSAIRIKNYGMASAAYDRILIIEPEYNLIKFEQAKLLYITGNEKDAEVKLKKLLDEKKLSKKLKKLITEYIDFINDNKKLLDVSLSAMLGVNFHTNATSSPSDKYTLPNFTYLGEQGEELVNDLNFFHLYNLNISKKFLNNENVLFKNSFTYFDKIYKNEKDENFEYYSYKPSLLINDNTDIYSIGASFERYQPKVDDGSEYYNSFGISSFKYNKDYMIIANAQRYFYDEDDKKDKNYTRYQTKVQFHDIYGFKFSSLFTKDIKFKSTRTDIDKVYIDSILSYNYDINKNFSIDPSFRYKIMNYLNESIAFGSKRKDSLKEYRLDFRNNFDKNFYTTFYISYLDNYSNHDEYRYDNLSLGILFVKRFVLF